MSWGFPSAFSPSPFRIGYTCRPFQKRKNTSVPSGIFTCVRLRRCPNTSFGSARDMASQPQSRAAVSAIHGRNAEFGLSSVT